MGYRIYVVVVVLVSTWAAQVAGVARPLHEIGQLPRNSIYKVYRGPDGAVGDDCISETVIQKDSVFHDSFQYKCAENKYQEINQEFVKIDGVLYTDEADKIWWLKDEKKCELHDYKNGKSKTTPYSGEECNDIRRALGKKSPGKKEYSSSGEPKRGLISRIIHWWWSLISGTLHWLWSLVISTLEVVGFKFSDKVKNFF